MTEPTEKTAVVLAGKERRLRYTAAALIRLERSNPDSLGIVERTMLVLWHGLSKEDQAEFTNFGDFTELVTLEELKAAGEAAGAQMAADGPTVETEAEVGNPMVPASAA